MEYLVTKSGVAVVGTSGEVVAIKEGDSIQLFRYDHPKPEMKLFAWESGANTNYTHHESFKITDIDGPFIYLEGTYFTFCLTLDPNVEHRKLGFPTAIKEVEGSPHGTHRSFYLDADGVAYVTAICVQAEKEEDTPALAA